MLRLILLYIMLCSTTQAHESLTENNVQDKKAVDLTPKEHENKNDPLKKDKNLRVKKSQKTHVLSVDKNESTIFHSPVIIDELFVVDNKIAEVKTIDNQSFYIFGLVSGSTKVYVSSPSKEDAYTITVHVTYPIDKLKNVIDKTIPKHNIRVIPLQKGILLEGSVDTSQDAVTVQKLAEQYIEEKDTIINNIFVKSSTQISLEVKIAEVSRKAMNKLNIDWSGTLRSGVTSFGTSYQSSSPRNVFTIANGSFNVNAALDMLINDNKATVLAEPTLMTLSGRSASFNAGGEIPYQGSTSNNSGGTSPQIEFKQYGIQLSFTPTVMGDSIHLDLKTEVSDPDESLKLEANGVSIPAIRKKDAQTTVVLGDGQSLMIAGLLYNKRSSTSNRFPGLSDIPIVGGAFSNESNDDEERELVIVVTPHRVQPINPSQPVAVLPADYKTVSASDAFFFSKRNLSDRKPISSTFKAGLVY